MEKNKVCFIRCYKREGDYVSDGIKKLGYQIVIPYKDTNLFRRLVREAWFRLHLPGRKLFFNKKLKNIDADVFVIADSLMCKQFLYWIKSIHPNSRICLNYENRVNRTFDPSVLDESLIERWSYDMDDCKTYNMKFVHAALVDAYNFDAREKVEDKYDIVFLGRDKNRAEYLKELENKFTNLGLRSYFYICADRSFLKFRNKIYKPLMPYEDYLNLLKCSKAALNIMPEGQISLTQREIETAFYNIKCVTNNKGVLTSDLYDKSRYFVIGVDDFKDLPSFLNEPIKPVDSKLLFKYSFENFAKTFIKDKPGEE